MSIPFYPWLDRVLVKRPKFTNKGGIIIPDEAQRRHSHAKGEIIAVGPQCSDYVTVGQHVLWGAHGGGWLDQQDVKSEEDFDYFVLSEEDILGEVKD